MHRHPWTVRVRQRGLAGRRGLRRQRPGAAGVAETTGAELLGLEVGDMVVHGTWGEGRVVGTPVARVTTPRPRSSSRPSVGSKLLLRMAPVKRRGLTPGRRDPHRALQRWRLVGSVVFAWVGDPP